MSDKRYCWSDEKLLFDGDFATREEALADARASGLYEVWTGVSVPFIPELSAEFVIDDLVISAMDAAGEAAEDWLDGVPAEECADLETALNAALHAWLDKHGYQPTFWQVTEIQKHAATKGE